MNNEVMFSSLSHEWSTPDEVNAPFPSVVVVFFGKPCKVNF